MKKSSCLAVFVLPCRQAVQQRQSHIVHASVQISKYKAEEMSHVSNSSTIRTYTGE